MIKLNSYYLNELFQTSKACGLLLATFVVKSQAQNTGLPENLLFDRKYKTGGTYLFNVNYGREFFHINSTIRLADGKIVKADMYNHLNLKVRVNCDKDYKNWQVEVPFEEERKLTLELL